MRFDSKLNKLIRSIVALFLILSFLVTATFTWLSDSTSSKVDANDYITISADAGLNMNYGYGDNNQGTMQIPKDCVLAECSSKDGKNFFFPLSAYGADGDKDFTNGIEEKDDFIYREATALDKNKKYLSLDLELTSETNSSVWLSNESYIRNNNENNEQTSANAVRVAFINKDSLKDDSIVFDNSPLKSDSEANRKNGHYKPIWTINRDGTGATTSKDENYRPHAISEYTNNNSDGNVIFELKANEPLHITVNIWLEGTDPHCKNNVLDVKDLDILIKFSTSYEDADLYYFKDYTLEKWVANHESYICAVDANIPADEIQSTDLIQFEQSSSYDSDYTWFGTIPAHITNVKFVRLNPELENASHEEWNFWDAGNIGSCKTFNAFGHSAGMWADNFSPTTITLFDGTPDGFVHKNLFDYPDASTPYTVHIAFNIEDGNGNDSSHNYKLSYHHQRTQWQINIPSNATDISFNMLETEDFEVETPIDVTDAYFTWETTRTDELYYTMNFDNDGLETGYWSDELIYVDAYNDETGESFTDEDAYIAAYFFDTESDFNTWTGMHAKTDSGRFKAAVPPELMKSNMVDQNPDTATIYFTNAQGWTTPKIHYWGSPSSGESTWPGIAMTKSHKNGYGQDIYKVEIPADATGFLFSDNGHSNKRTNNITGIKLKDGMGFYANSDKTYGQFTNYRPGVVITRYDVYAYDWDWSWRHNQTSDDLTTYGNTNLFYILDYSEEHYDNDENPYLVGEWHQVNNP